MFFKRKIYPAYLTTSFFKNVTNLLWNWYLVYEYIRFLKNSECLFQCYFYLFEIMPLCYYRKFQQRKFCFPNNQQCFPILIHQTIFYFSGTYIIILMVQEVFYTKLKVAMIFFFRSNNYLIIIDAFVED